MILTTENTALLTEHTEFNSIKLQHLSFVRIPAFSSFRSVIYNFVWNHNQPLRGIMLVELEKRMLRKLRRSAILNIGNKQ